MLEYKYGKFSFFKWQKKILQHVHLTQYILQYNLICLKWYMPPHMNIRTSCIIQVIRLLVSKFVLS